MSAPPHGHDHDHDHQVVPSDPALRVKALESLLTEKGLVDPAALDALIDTYQHKVGPRNGARVVARAWLDPAYKQRLLADGTNAIAELGYGGAQGEHMVVVENTPSVHNLIVCTLCSCYPWSVLGLPPVWYKSAPYRSRAVIDPRGVLREFGVELAEEKRNTRLGQHGRTALPGPAGAAGRKRRTRRGSARRVGYARCHDRRREGALPRWSARERRTRHGRDARHGPASSTSGTSPFFTRLGKGAPLRMVLAAAAWRKWSLDALRHQIERIPPADYLRMSYYEKWLTAVTERLIAERLDHSRRSSKAASRRPVRPRQLPPLTADQVPSMRRSGALASREVRSCAALSSGPAGPHAQHPSNRTHAPASLRPR